MGLREQAKRDLGVILNDTERGFAWPVSVESPDGVLDDQLKGFSTDISQMIDPDTGQLVSGRLASVALTTADLLASFGKLPRGVADQAKRPWLVTFNDIDGESHTFKVRQSDPDRAVGCLVCILEGYDGCQ